MPRNIPEKKLADCLELYLANNGENYKAIEAGMRERGWTNFSARCLTHSRSRRYFKDGWVKEYGWDKLLDPKKRERLERRRILMGFPAWLKQVTPRWKWVWKYQEVIYKALDEIQRKEGGGRLMIFIPPRHGKSELVTIRYSAWRLEVDPTSRIIIGSYNQKLANRFSRNCRSIVKGRIAARKLDEVKKRTIGPWALSQEKTAADEWETTVGGGVKAVGVGAGITGFGANLAIIDDPIKSRAEAESRSNRDRVWDWFKDDVYTRLEPGAAVILIQTRWHEDDLAGRLLKEAEDGGERWEVVKLPALSEPPASAGGGLSRDDRVDEGENGSNPERFVADTEARRSTYLPPADAGGSDWRREPGIALCPERYDEAALLRIKRKLGSYSFAALYQQEPVPSEGGLFKREWFSRIADRAPDGLSWVRAYDLAVSTKTTADYTASFRCAIDKRSGDLYIADGFRKRIEFPEQRRYIKERIAEERDTRHCIEAALHGQAFVQELQREVRFAGRGIQAVRPDADKTSRAHAWTARAEAGKVVLVRGAWIDEFLDEVCRFPHGKHDDQVDAVSLAVQMIARAGGKGAMGF